MTIPVGYAEVQVQYDGNGAPTGAVNTIGVKLEDPADTPGTVAAKVLTVWVNNLLENMTDDVRVSGLYVKFGPDDVGAFGQFSANQPGTIASTSSAPNTAFLVTKNTLLGGRRGRGRMFIPGVAEAAIDDGGFLTGTWPADWQADLTQALADLATADVPMYLLHGPATEWVLVDGQPRRVPVAGSIPVPTEVTSLTIQSQAATQRRRLRR